MHELYQGSRELFEGLWIMENWDRVGVGINFSSEEKKMLDWLILETDAQPCSRMLLTLTSSESGTVNLLISLPNL